MEIVDSDHIKFAPDTLARLGEELIPNPDQGIIELVRNSYDADASTCAVDFSQADTKSIITIKDTGDGMDLDAIRNGWFVLGHSAKADDTNKRTRKGRLPVGDKGLGRLAALRMGRSAILETRPKSQPGVLYRVTFDWSRFRGQRLVEDVDFKIEEGSTDKKPGTDITLVGVRARFRRRELERLARNLLLLTDPFGSPTGFKAILKAPGFKELERKVKRAYFGDAEYRLEARLTSDGLSSAHLLDWRNRITHRASHGDISNNGDLPYRAVAADLSLWVFLLSGETFSARKSSMTEVRDWLSVVGGVQLYYRRLRVPPYGDRGHDWLEMNLARAKSPEERPSTNNSIGKVVVEDPEHFLTQKTDRIGFIETEQFQELRRFAMDALEWMAKVRLREAEIRRERERLQAPKTVTRAVEKLDQIVEDMPPKYRAPLTQAIRKVEQAAKREAKVLRDDLQLYRSLATAGTTAAAFAHESAKPISRIGDLVSLIKKRALRLLGRQYEILEKPVNLLERSTTSLKGFAAIPIYLLKRDKRKAERVNVQEVIDNVLEVFEPILLDAKISASRQSVDSNSFIQGSVALVEAIITNFLTNSVQAFNREDSQPDKRKVMITTEVSGNFLLIDFSDNGPGITDIKLDDIWLPGRTTLAGGTGFGLTIVRDAVADLGGNVRAIARGQLGGAEFIVSLPLMGD